MQQKYCLPQPSRRPYCCVFCGLPLCRTISTQHYGKCARDALSKCCRAQRIDNNPTPQVASGDVGLAFGLAVAAGMATALGAACVLFGSLCKPRILAGSLGFAAGVMLYVSFVEIFATKSVGAFIDNGATDAEAVRYATGCFFGGILLVYLLDLIVCGITALAVWARERDMQKRVCVGATDSRMTLAHPPQAITSLKRLLSRKSLAITNPSDAPEPSPDPPSPDPESPPSQEPACLSTHVHDLVHSVQQAVCTPLPDPPASDDTPPLPVPRDPDVLQLLQDDPHSAALMRTGVLTAIAIFCHNFPEGLATFVATLADPSVGASVAFAIALHNAVEGVCVALPIYYATGSRWKVGVD